MTQKDNNSDLSDEKEVDQFFDANDRLADETKSANRENPASEAVGVNQRAGPSSWKELKRVFTSIGERIIPQKDDNPMTTEQIIISIKDEHKRELQVEEENAKTDQEDDSAAAESEESDKKDTQKRRMKKMRES